MGVLVVDSLEATLMYDRDLAMFSHNNPALLENKPTFSFCVGGVFPQVKFLDVRRLESY